MTYRRFKTDKLVRDKTVERFRAQHVRVGEERILSTNEYIQRLKDKIVEEAREVQEATSSHELAAELADVLEVIDALCTVHGLSKQDVHTVQEKKRAERGGFEKRLYVGYIDAPENSVAARYCARSPHKYPLIENKTNNR